MDRGEDGTSAFHSEQCQDLHESLGNVECVLLSQRFVDLFVVVCWPISFFCTTQLTFTVSVCHVRMYVAVCVNSDLSRYEYFPTLLLNYSTKPSLVLLD